MRYSSRPGGETNVLIAPLRDGKRPKVQFSLLHFGFPLRHLVCGGLGTNEVHFFYF